MTSPGLERGARLEWEIIPRGLWMARYRADSFEECLLVVPALLGIYRAWSRIAVSAVPVLQDGLNLKQSAITDDRSSRCMYAFSQARKLGKLTAIALRAIYVR
jgi:hypothetical protein